MKPARKTYKHKFWKWPNLNLGCWERKKTVGGKGRKRSGWKGRDFQGLATIKGDGATVKRASSEGV